MLTKCTHAQSLIMQFSKTTTHLFTVKYLSFIIFKINTVNKRLLFKNLLCKSVFQSIVYKIVKTSLIKLNAI